MVWVRDLDILVEGQRLRSLGDDFGLKVDGRWLQEKSWLDTNTFDDSVKTAQLANTSEFEWKNEVPLSIDSSWSILNLEFKRASFGSEAELNMSVLLFLIIFFVLHVFV